MTEPDARNVPAGYLNVDKPSGWTSSDVVSKLRSAFQLRKRKIKIGHGGTLDPMATGVLPICIGSATRLSQYLLNSDKSYRASILLGISTDTYDADGAVVSTADPSQVTKDMLDSVLERFKGRFEQLPPIYSAIKKDGRPLYSIARAGGVVPRSPRLVEARAIELTNFHPPNIDLYIECAKGFYVRSLAHDIGEALGCGAHLTSLRRTRAGDFSIEESILLPHLLELTPNDNWTQHLKPIDFPIQALPRISLDPQNAQRFAHGRAVRLSTSIPPTIDKTSSITRVYDDKGVLIGLARTDDATTSIQPHLVLTSPNPKTQPSNRI